MRRWGCSHKRGVLAPDHGLANGGPSLMRALSVVIRNFSGGMSYRCAYEGVTGKKVSGTVRGCLPQRKLSRAFRSRHRETVVAAIAVRQRQRRIDRGGFELARA